MTTADILPAIKISNLTVYYGCNPALININLDIRQGEFLGIVGPNGGGKTTLLKSILGLVPRLSGELQIFGKSRQECKRLIGYVPQLSQLDSKFPITVKEVVMSGLLSNKTTVFNRVSDKQADTVRRLLTETGLEGLACRQISNLSGGEFQKMLVARALAIKPKILLLDEPTASVDPFSKDQIYQLLRSLSRQITVIMVTHDTMSVFPYVERIVCLNRELLYSGDPSLYQQKFGLNGVSDINREIIPQRHPCQ